MTLPETSVVPSRSDDFNMNLNLNTSVNAFLKITFNLGRSIVID